MIRIEQPRTHIEEVWLTESFALRAEAYPNAGRFQQTTSGLGLTNPACYEIPGTCFALYGFEYKPGWVFHIMLLLSFPDHIYSFDKAYITWINEVRAWTLHAAGLDKDDAVEIGRRLIPVEPMVSTPQCLSRASM